MDEEKAISPIDRQIEDFYQYSEYPDDTLAFRNAALKVIGRDEEAIW